MASLTVTFGVNSTLDATRLLHALHMIALNGMEHSDEVQQLVKAIEGTPIKEAHIQGGK